MEQLSGKRSKAMLGISLPLMLAGTVFLLWGEAANLLWVFIDGLLIAGVGMAFYYTAGESRRRIEAGYHRLSKTMKFLLLVISCSPWVVLYFYIAPLWDAVLVAVLSVAFCAGYIWWWPRFRGKKTGGGDPESASTANGSG